MAWGVTEMHVNIVYDDNGVGLSRDAHIIETTLHAAGIRVTRTPISEFHYELPWNQFARWLHVRLKVLIHRLRFNRLPYDLTLFLEHIEPDYCLLAPVIAYIPNPEHSCERDVHNLKWVDHVLAKVHDTIGVYESLGCPVTYIGFTSLDRGMGLDSTKKRRAFFHLAGNSQQKGTAALIDLWKKHPEWPPLTILQHPDKKKRMPKTTGVANIRHISAYLDDDSLRTLQNEHRFHLCPSEAEGFGHYIVEALGCGAVTLTTDAPPMNELVEAGRGLLVRYCRKAPQQLGMNHIVCPDNLEEKITEMLALTDDQTKKISQLARDWFESNAIAFRHRLPEVILEIMAQHGSQATDNQASSPD